MSKLRSGVHHALVLALALGCASTKPATSPVEEAQAVVQEAPPPPPPPPPAPPPASAPPPVVGPKAAVVADTCSGTFPSYWQDPKFGEMWSGQEVSNVPKKGWDGPVFRLSDRFPASPQDDSGAQPWRSAKYDAMFAPATPQAARTALASDYIWELMRYIQEGNIESGDPASDWTLCNNAVRNWYHIPFQTYEVRSGREFVHGLTREASVAFSLKDPTGKSVTLPSTVWAVAFYNPTAAYTLGTVWRPDGTATPPTTDVAFDQGAVIGKLLFSTLSPSEMPFLRNVPAWKANISEQDCRCKGKACSSMAEWSVACKRSLGKKSDDNMVALLQFDVAVKDARAPGTGWVFGTFVADGERRASEANPWNRIAPLGLMWGNDGPAAGGLAANTPANPRANGFKSSVIFWDTVDMLNAAGGATAAMSPGHLGCNGRLNGPADNPSSTCMSCHMTASVPDKNLKTPPIMPQFGGITSECVTPSATDPTKGIDAAGNAATELQGIAFSKMDGLYFADVACGTPMNMVANTKAGPVNVLGKDVPSYADGHAGWISLDYSLQLSISLTQWGEWQQVAGGTKRVKNKSAFESVLPGR